MFKNNTNYLVEFTQNTAKQILQNSESYVGRLVTDKETNIAILEFVHKSTSQKIKFSLHETKLMPKVTYSFVDSQEPKLEDPIQMRCIAVTEATTAKRPRPQEMILDSDEDSDGLLDIGNEDKGEANLRGWIGNNEERNNNIRKMILKILHDNPEGNISPKEVLAIIKQNGEYPTQKFVKDEMELFCEPSSQKTNRKYILLDKFRVKDAARKRVKLNEE